VPCCLRCPPPPKNTAKGANPDTAYGHAVNLVGYNNIKEYWVVRSSWGPNVGDDGYFKVAFGVSGIAPTDNTWGLRFAPLKPIPAYSADQVSPAAKQGCYTYKAASDDYLSNIAHKFAVSVKELALDNPEFLGDPTMSLAGRSVLVCNAREVASVLPPASQADALLRMKAAIDPDNVLSTWKVAQEAKATGYCEWAGITCDDKGDVTKVLLQFEALGDTRKLSGVLPGADVLLALPGLRQFTILNHKLVGTLPDDYSKLTKLQVLTLAGSLLRGTLPTSWSAMKSLRSLSFGGFNTNGDKLGNLLQGTLPPEWAAMTSLNDLAISNNQLTGPLPASWGKLPLKALELSYNKLTGSIPDSWAGLVTDQLGLLEVDNNRLSGALPPGW